MNRYYPVVRRPVRRPGAESYLLVTLFSFALSVSLTRLFLELTGYPQLGSDGLHIAHVLWGGLLLFIAALLPLIIANRWVYQLGAILTGVGVGLFIDEVGKFITQENDYFYPPAAPIIYTFFLITVLLYLRIKRPSTRQSRTELYISLELIEELLDHDLDARERKEIDDRLSFVLGHEEQSEFSRFAENLLGYIRGESLYLADTKPRFIQRLDSWFRMLENKYLDQNGVTKTLAISMFLMGMFAIISAASSLVTFLFPGPEDHILVSNIGLLALESLSWFYTLHILQGFVGLALLAGGAFLLRGSDRKGITIGFYALLVYLTGVDLLLFYYYQFSTIVNALIQFALLLGLLYYRGKYLVQETT